MTQPPKRQHDKVWALLQGHFGPCLRDLGFAPHPAWSPIYEPSNRMWECSFIAPPGPDGIRVVDLHYAPHDRQWWVIGYLYACADSADRIARLAGSTPLWSAEMLALPWRRTDLDVPSGGAFWRKAFWRPARAVWFSKKTGEPVRLDLVLQRAARVLPAFVAELNRPGHPLRDSDFMPRADQRRKI